MKKKLLRLLSLILVGVMLCSVAPTTSMTVEAAYDNTHKNTGDQRVDIVEIAKTQLGNTNGNKYGSGSWCAHFVIWCARQAGVSSSVIATTGYACADDMKVPYYSRTSYSPKSGDLVFFNWPSTPQYQWDHVGIVEKVNSDGSVTTIEGNNSGAVRRTTYYVNGSSEYNSLSSIRGYGVPKYNSSMKESTKYPTPLRAYTLATGKTTVYSSINGSAKTNKIYDTDRCTISAIYENGWCKVTFPLDAGETDTGYVKTAVFLNPDYSLFNVTTGKKLTIYTRSDLSEEIGNISADTSAQVVGHTSKAVQILYPRTSGDYGVGWVPMSVFTYTIAYNANSGTGTMASTTAKYDGTMTLASNKFTKIGHTFTGWNVYRSSDKAWYVKGIGWKTNSQISENNYTKSVYKDELSCNFSSNWIKGGKTNDTLTFYPIWEANTLSVYFNANGATIDSDTYKLSGNLVYNKDDGSKTVQTWIYNEPKKNGLANASTLGLSKTGHSFKGWGTSASGGTIFSQSDTDLVPTSINSNLKTESCSKTLYAIWEPNTYAVKYNANGGTGAPSAQVKTYGTTLKLSSNIPTRNGYAFKGWATTSTATSATYQAGANYTTNKAVTLYAVWEVVETETTHTHEWNSDYTVDIEPTCTEEGVKSIHCKTCGESVKITVIPVLEHKYDEVILREASCSSSGEKAQRCVVCGYETEYTKIPMEEHNLVTTVITEATCTQEGLWQDVCSECQLHTNSKVIPMDEHEFCEWKVIKEANANGDGLEERKCEKCQNTETRLIHYIPVHDEKTPMLSVGSAQVIAGNKVRVPVELENNPGFCNLSIVFVYDTDYMELISAENQVTSMNMTSDTIVEWNDSEDYLTDGTLAILSFEVEEEIPDGDYEIQIYILNAINEQSDKIDILGISGTISVSSIAVAGWKKDNIGWWYQNADGSYPQSTWKEIRDEWYYFNSAGYMVTGWQFIGTTWYYFDGSGAMVTEWRSIGSAWYYFNEDGAMVTGWQLIDGTWYHFNGSGAMMTGWQSIGGTWYYFNGSGAMVTDWQSFGGTWYYFNGSGTMVTGWQLIDGKWYYFESSGAMVANRWIGNYYLKADGSMATNEYIGVYYVGADGVWIP